MFNRLLNLPDQIQKIIWKYYFSTVLIEMYQKIFIKDPLISMIITPKKLCFYTWNDIYSLNNNYQTFIFRKKKKIEYSNWHKIRKIITDNNHDRWYISNNLLYYKTNKYYLL